MTKGNWPGLCHLYFGGMEVYYQCPRVEYDTIFKSLSTYMFAYIFSYELFDGSCELFIISEAASCQVVHGSHSLLALGEELLHRLKLTDEEQTTQQTQGGVIEGCDL